MRRFDEQTVYLDTLYSTLWTWVLHFVADVKEVDLLTGSRIIHNKEVLLTLRLSELVGDSRINTYRWAKRHGESQRLVPKKGKHISHTQLHIKGHE